MCVHFAVQRNENIRCLFYGNVRTLLNSCSLSFQSLSFLFLLHCSIKHCVNQKWKKRSNAPEKKEHEWKKKGNKKKWFIFSSSNFHMRVRVYVFESDKSIVVESNKILICATHFNVFITFRNITSRIHTEKFTLHSPLIHFGIFFNRLRDPLML